MVLHPRIRDRARRRDFSDSIQGSLLYNAGAFAASFGLIFLIPAPRRRLDAAPVPEAH